MNWLEFFVSLIDSLAWPAAIAFVVFVLRVPLRRVARGLKQFGFGGVTLEFSDAVEEAENVAAQAELPPAELLLAGAPEKALSTELASTIDTSPRAAVANAYFAVARELAALADNYGIKDADANENPSVLADVLRERGVLDQRLASVIDELWTARNVAAHSPSYAVERNEVRNYVKLAGRVRTALRATLRKMAEEGQSTYDLLVYQDLSDPTESTGGRVPAVGDPAEPWFGSLGRDRHVVAVGPGIHPDRVTVVLAHGDRPMPEVQRLLDQLDKE